jgi:hypothetical protein
MEMTISMTYEGYSGIVNSAAGSSAVGIAASFPIVVGLVSSIGSMYEEKNFSKLLAIVVT